MRPLRPGVSRRRAERAARAVLVVVGLVLGLLLAEAGYRAWLSRHPRGNGSFLTSSRGLDEYRLYEFLDGPQKLDLLPDRHLGFLSTNSLAMRDREYAADKPPGTFRILALGDSVTFGVQVPMEQTWEAALEDRLSARGALGLHYEVLNLGVPGYNTEQSWLRYQRRALGLRPDLVVLQWGANDLDMSPIVLLSPGSVVYLYWGDGTSPPAPYRLLPAVNAWGIAHSALYRDASFASFVWLDRWLAPDRKFDDVRRRNLDAMLSLRDAAAAQGARFAVALFPDVTDFEHPRDARERAEVLDFLGRNGVPVVDLLPAFRGLAPEVVRLAPGDPVHLGARGYAHAAGALEAGLREGGLLPGP